MKSSKHLFWSQCSKIIYQLQEKKKPIKNSNIWRLNNTILNNQQITEEIKICIETSENENTTIQNLWDSVKAVLRGKFIAIQAYLRKQKNKINNLTLYLEQPEKEEMKNTRVSGSKEIIQIRVEIKINKGDYSKNQQN